MKFGKLWTFGKGTEKQVADHTTESTLTVAEATADDVSQATDRVVEETEAQYKAELTKKMSNFRSQVDERVDSGETIFEAQTSIVAEEISDGLKVDEINELLAQIKTEIEVGKKTDFGEFNQGTVVILISRLGEALFSGKAKEGVPPEIYHQAINEIGLRIAEAFNHQVSMNTVYPGYAIQIPGHEVVNNGAGNKVGEVLSWGCEISGQSHTRMPAKVKAAREEDLPPFVGTSFLFPEDL